MGIISVLLAQASPCAFVLVVICFRGVGIHPKELQLCQVPELEAGHLSEGDETRYVICLRLSLEKAPWLVLSKIQEFSTQVVRLDGKFWPCSGPMYTINKTNKTEQNKTPNFDL